MTYAKCRHWNSERDYCVALKVLGPRDICDGCDQYSPNGMGLGDVVEKVISTATLGQAKKVAKKVRPGGCGCAKRKAALNRLGDRVSDTLKGK